MGVKGSVAGGSGGRAARALRLLLLLVLALAAVEYLFGSILDAASPLRTYLYMPGYNTTQSTLRTDKYMEPWPKRVVSYPDLVQSNDSALTRNSSQRISNTSDTSNIKLNSTNSMFNNTITFPNVTRILNSSVIDNELTTPTITKIVESIKNSMTTEEDSNNNITRVKRKLCPDMPPDLGPVPVNKTNMELDWVEKKFPEVFWGGRYSPPDCEPRYKVSIIVPYRDRQQHLAIFLNHMHPFLMKQKLDYGIFIIEQAGSSEFNRAKLMNVGFAESQRLRVGGWQCFVFHDIDLLPLDGRNMYSCPRQPRHMSASIDKYKFKLPYENIFGGVSAMTKEQFTKVNGFSNNYWGWGAEDDDMFHRIIKMNYHVARYKMSIARYAMLDHKKSSPNPKRFKLLSQAGKTFAKEGLSTLKYEVVDVTPYHLYTHVRVNIDERS